MRSFYVHCQAAPYNAFLIKILNENIKLDTFHHNSIILGERKPLCWIIDGSSHVITVHGLGPFPITLVELKSVHIQNGY